MKPTFFHRLRLRLGLSRHKKKQGVAILTVLAIITLMTVLVISFFNMAQTSKTTAKGSVEIQRVTTLKDTIINLVVAQFREASKLAPVGTDPQDIITWTSQPGAIRTYSGTNPENSRLFKLYSSAAPQIGPIRPFATDQLLTEIGKDNVPDWAERPDEFTDLNRPVYTAASGDRASANTGTSSEGFSFPIADPRAYNGQSTKGDLEKNVEGFSYSEKAGTSIIKGVDPRKEQLAMPVRWIYLLQDGTLGYLNGSGEFTTLNGSEGGDVSKENPIVGRLAWWADDESCKINVNTASVPAAWDTPRTTSQEDKWLAQNPPIALEFQRYPGHPATVDLSAVFYPNRRWVPPGLVKILGPSGAGGSMTLMDQADAFRIWNLAPFIVGEKTDVAANTTGTGGGVYATPGVGEIATGLSSDDRLFTSMDEVYFKASGSKSASLNEARQNLLKDNKDPQLKFLERLERSQFFLTHKSHSPEMTNQGFPRISMFPMDSLAAPAVAGTNSGVPTGVSPSDITIALNSTIGKTGGIPNAYYFQRRDPTSRHNEFYKNAPRNFAIFKYLKELSKLPIPGFPEAVAITGVPSAAAEDPKGLSFATKYPAAADSTGKEVYKSYGGANAVNDSSERTQILMNMLDFTRSFNMQPAFLQNAAEKYDLGWGKASGICGCALAAPDDTNTTHYQALNYLTKTRSPKGTGKLYGPSEIAIVVNVAARRDPRAPAQSAIWTTMLGKMDDVSRGIVTKDTSSILYAVEVGFVAAGFNPKVGWSPTFPECGIALTTTYAGTGTDVLCNTGGTPAERYLPIRVGNVQLEVFGGTRLGANVSHTLPKSGSSGVEPLGGMGGPRSMFGQAAGAGNAIAIARPFVVANASGAGANVNIPFQIDSTLPLRIFPMDGDGGGGDCTMAIDLLLPSNFLSNINLPLTGESLLTLAPKWAAGTAPFPGPNVALRSFVVPHGDYRITATPSRVEADMFVPVANYTAPRAYSFFEMNSDPALRADGISAFNPDQGLLQTKYVRQYGLSRSTPVESLTGLPLPLGDLGRIKQLTFASANFTYPVPAAGPSGNGELISGSEAQKVNLTPFAPLEKVTFESASLEPERRPIFAHGRRDGRGLSPNRGSSDPSETGDFDTGPGGFIDGPYMNYPDEGDRRKDQKDAYYKKTNYNAQKDPRTEGVAGQCLSPNFLVRSPVDFGSIPTGVAARVPWQTLRFRPDIGMNNPALRMKDAKNDRAPVGLPFANFCGPKDHFFLDMFWMPVVEPWAISEPFSTKGTINLNQQILPFTNIERTTALHALMRGERMYAIPNEAAKQYKDPKSSTPTYRQFINAKETMTQFTKRYKEGKDFEEQQLAFNTFRSASEICEVWLVPENNKGDGAPLKLRDVIGTINGAGVVKSFWADHRLTGDNLRERPYANLYPRVTVRSNVFKLHMVAQTLQKATSENPKSFDSVKDSVTAEWRGSCMIERSIDPRDPLLDKIDYTNLNSKIISPTVTPKLDQYYTYRVTEVKQLTQ